MPGSAVMDTVEGSIFWEQVGGIRFGGLCAAAYANRPLFDRILMWVTETGSRGAAASRVTEFFGNEKNRKRMNILSSIYLFTNGMFERSTCVTVYEPATLYCKVGMGRMHSASTFPKFDSAHS